MGLFAFLRLRAAPRRGKRKLRHPLIGRKRPRQRTRKLLFRPRARGCLFRLIAGEETEEGEESVVSRLFITVNESKAEIILENNISVSALVERLRTGDITYTADDYGGFEKVGAIGFSLPRDDAHIQTRPGDVILYQGNQIVLFYGENSWSYTRLGRIEGLSDAQLRAFLHAGEGEIQVTLSLDG